MLRALPGIEDAVIATSPRRRARDTCRLAGFGDRAVVWPELAEWDYGFAEGRTTAEIRREIPGWSVWTHPGGESLAEIGARAEAVIARADASPGLVVLFSHAHLIRITGACWWGGGRPVARISPWPPPASPS